MLKVIRITSNLKLSAECNEECKNIERIFIATHDKANVLQIIKYCTEFFKSDAIILNQADIYLYLLSMLKWVLSYKKCKLISLDIILMKPKSLSGRFICAVKKLLLKNVDLFLLYFKDTAGYSTYYGIPAERMKYIPFKINSADLVLNKKFQDEGYIFAGGRSRRDWDTLKKAIHLKELTYPFVILTPKNEEARHHGSEIPENDWPDNVKIIHDDGSSASWVDYMSGARMVVIPILEDSLAPSGIGTYLVAMGLGKCVIITDGPATAGILTNETAMLVPAQDACSLGEAIKKAYEDDEFRQSLAEKGKSYALSLGGIERLFSDILRHALELLQQSGDVAAVQDMKGP